MGKAVNNMALKRGVVAAACRLIPRKKRAASLLAESLSRARPPPVPGGRGRSDVIFPCNKVPEKRERQGQMRPLYFYTIRRNPDKMHRCTRRRRRSAADYAAADCTTLKYGVQCGSGVLRGYIYNVTRQYVICATRYALIVRRYRHTRFIVRDIF